MIYVGIFVAGISFGVWISVWIFTYCINRLDIWIGPEPYVKKKILKKRAIITGVYNDNRTRSMEGKGTCKKESVGRNGKNKKETLSGTGANKARIVGKGI